MKIAVPAGTTSKRMKIFVYDSSSTTGGGLTGLVYNSAGLTWYYTKDGDSSATQVTLATATLGTWASGGFKEVDSANMPGVYEIGVPNAAIAAGDCHMVIKGATNMVPVAIEIQTANLPANTQQVSGTNQTARDLGASVLLSPGTGTGQVSLSSGKVPATIAAGDIATDAINASSLNADAVAEIQSGLATSSALTTLAGKFSGITLLKNWLAVIMGKAADSGTLAEVNATTAGASFSNTTMSLQKLSEQVTLNGIGANTVTITVNDGTSPIQLAHVAAWSGSQLVATGTTNASGVTILSLDNGTYNINITANGFNGSAGNSLVVSGATSHTYSLTTLTITPSEPPEVTGYLYCYDQFGVVQAGVPHTLTLIQAPSGDTGTSLSQRPRTVMSASDGLVEFTGMIALAVYTIRRGSGSPVRFTADDATFAITALAG